MKIAVTGGVGVGKSTVIKALKEQYFFEKYTFISVDDIVKDLYSQGDMIDILNRLDVSIRELSHLFFQAYIRDLVEKVANPLIDRLLESLKEENIVVEFPLAYREDFNNILAQFDLVLSITANPELRKKRVMKRDGMNESKFLQMVSLQPSQGIVDARADMVFENRGVNNSELSDDEFKESIDFLVKLIARKEAKIAKRDSKLNRHSNDKKEAKIGVVPGSFDPIQFGHLHVIKRALSLVDSIVIVIAKNSQKTSKFTNHLRAQMIRESIIATIGQDVMTRVSIEVLPEDKMLITYAQEVNAKFIFRGLRSGFDFDYEHSINSVQKDIDPEIETVYIMTPNDLTQVSSSMIKSISKFPAAADALKKYVPEPVFKSLTSKGKIK